MRILHVFDHSIPLQSGYSFRSRAILLAQRARGWQTFHLTGPKQGNTRVLSENVGGLEFYRAPPGDGWLERLPLLDQISVVRRLGRRLAEVAESVRPDVLHAHSPVLNALATLPVGRRLRIPVVYEVRAFWEDAAVDHGTTTEGSLRYRLTRALETWALRRADAVTCICEGLRADIVARGVPPGRVTVIPNAVEQGLFRSRGDARALKARLGFGEGPVIGFIGSFYAYEGLTLLVKALPAILAARPDVQVLLAGGGPDRERVESMLAEASLQASVRVVGRIPHEDVHRYYDLVDLHVYPRLSMRLTNLVTPLKPLEAMAQGGLVVASDVGGHRELIRDGETGILFPAGDADRLTGAVVRALGLPDGGQALRAAGQRFVSAERDWAAVAARYERVYESCRRSGS